MEDDQFEKYPAFKYHRFLDEAGDITFYGKGKTPVVGQEGVSKCFILGLLKINEPLGSVRQRIIELQNNIAGDPYFDAVPSIQKKKTAYGYYLHAKDDVPEVRKMAYELIKSVDCTFEAVAARKIYDLYEKKHNGKEAEFYADLLGHLLKDKFAKHNRLVLNIAERKKCTTHHNLTKGLQKTITHSTPKYLEPEQSCKVVFNVQQPTAEPLLNLADYFCWAVQRVFEKGETRYYDFIKSQVSSIWDVYDFEKDETNKNFYSGIRPLTAANLLK